MYRLSWDIRIGGYKLVTLSEVKITTSVMNLCDTATIALPGQCMGRWSEIEDKVKVGDAVTIKLGYNDDVETEFEGYLKRIARENNRLVLECEDALYLMDKSVEDMEYTDITLKGIIEDILNQVGDGFSIDCDYDYKYDKMVVYKSKAIDVLKKVHEETKANIWFEGNTLHIHPVYMNVNGGRCHIYDVERNVQRNELKWTDINDRKIQVEVVYTDSDGNRKNKKYGPEGGQKITKYINSGSEDDMRAAAENEHSIWNYSGYDGSFTGWMVPKARSGESVRLIDRKRNSDGVYYVTGVEITFGSSGGKRKVTLGRRIG